VEHWNVAAVEGGKKEAQYILLNKTKTLIRVSPRVHIDLGKIMSEIEKLGVPLKYSEGVEQITFTVLTGDARGWWKGDEIWVDASRLYRDEAVTTLVHEFGHHMDDREGLSDELHDERKKKGKTLGNREARKDTEEYVAIGFEKFYSEDPSDRKRLRRQNPQLYEHIIKMHRKYAHH
jgi:hypothetical protein